MEKQKDVASLYSSQAEKKRLWKAAIKWPLYSLAVMPVILAASWRLGAGLSVRIDQLIGFLFASILLLLWENLTNDLFDSETGVDDIAKPHSVVVLLGGARLVKNLAILILFMGLTIILLLSSKSNYSVLYLILCSCGLGYLYQGPPFRLGYKGLGEPLCWLAFGPLATAAGLIVISPINENINVIPWRTATLLGAGPALATTLVLFCSHFHQVTEDAAHGKRSPLVLLGTKRSAKLIPVFLACILLLESFPVIIGAWPLSALLGAFALPQGIKLTKLLARHHDHPEQVSNSKFLALRFQAINGFGLSLGLVLPKILELI